MPANHTKSSDYESLKSGKNGGADLNQDKTLKGSKKNEEKAPETLINPRIKDKKREHPSKESETALTGDFVFKSSGKEPEESFDPEEELTYSELQKYKKEEKKAQKDFELLNNEFWLARNGHTLTYIGLYLFSILVLFRPYDIFSSLSFLSATAFYFALITLAFYLPTQLLTEGSFTTFPTEVKAVLAMTFLALVTMPIAKSPGTAWEAFNEIFIKAVVMFIVMINVLRTRGRLMGMVWLSLSVGLFLSYTAVGMYWRGELNAEGYRVAVDIGGMFGNPNDMALHLVTMTPIAITIGIAAQKKWLKIFCFIMTAFFIAAISVTYSRGGFLGLIISSLVLIWKLGRKSRLKISIVSILVGGSFLLFAPGNYGLRMLSIFVPGLDPVGSSDQRKELLIRSIIVTLRNPWGIGIGNFPIVGVRNLETHNAYTQVSSELGLLGLAAYLIFMISPFRKLSAIERTLYAKNELNWFYYMSIGFQASIIGYMVSSFFGPVAYNWFVYYLIAYAVSFRRIYRLSCEENEIESNPNNSLSLQTA
jgi:O-antigen ligase